MTDTGKNNLSNQPGKIAIRFDNHKYQLKPGTLATIQGTNAYNVDVGYYKYDQKEKLFIPKSQNEIQSELTSGANNVERTEKLAFKRYKELEDKTNEELLQILISIRCDQKGLPKDPYWKHWAETNNRNALLSNIIGDFLRDNE